jgi:hypothetical protein
MPERRLLGGEPYYEDQEMKTQTVGRSMIVLILLLTAAVLLPVNATAQVYKAPPEEMRTLFVIGNLNTTVATYPLLVYIISDDELVHAETWNVTDRDYGPVGLAVDDTNEHLFVSYEASGKLDIFDARDLTPLGQIDLSSSGPDDLAGIVVHNDRGVLYVVDRGAPTVYEFDSSTFAPLGTWQVTQGCSNGAVALSIAGDVLYATCGSSSGYGQILYSNSSVYYWDIDTHAELGNFDILSEAVSIAVVDYPEKIAVIGGWTNNDYMVKYNIDTSMRSYVFLGDEGKGVAQNAALGYSYIVQGGGSVSFPPSVKVYNTETLTELHNYPINYNWTPTDLTASAIPFGGTVQKDSPTHPGGTVMFGEEITFEITIENRHINPIHYLPLRDVYDNTQLHFVSANPAPDDVLDDGEINWTNLVASFGQDLAPGASWTVEIKFTAVPDDCDPTAAGTNLAEMIGATDTGGEPLNNAAGRFDYIIDCHCQTDADCQDGSFCNGEEWCNADSECKPATEGPCPDNEIWCDGDEGCDEDLDECTHTGDPCLEGDGIFCNGAETCDEEGLQCISAGNPCGDDSLWCNGSESCDENDDQCKHSGNPCPPTEVCDDEVDECLDVEPEPPDPTPEPEEKDLLEQVAGGACG